jgi:hypothetical protein
VACLLMIDFANPVGSSGRAAMLKFVPASVTSVPTRRSIGVRQGGEGGGARH